MLPLDKSFLHSAWGGFVILRRYGWSYYQRDGQPHWNPHFVGVFPFLCLCRGGVGGGVMSRDKKSGPEKCAYVCFEAIFFRNYMWNIYEIVPRNISRKYIIWFLYMRYIYIYVCVYICGWRKNKHIFPPCSCKCECQPFVGFGAALDEWLSPIGSPIYENSSIFWWGFRRTKLEWIGTRMDHVIFVVGKLHQKTRIVLWLAMP